jgi:hypothetical protein
LDSYRIRKALTNVLKHAAAHNGNVLLAHKTGQLRIIMEDDDAGFDPKTIQAVLAPDAAGPTGTKSGRQKAAEGAEQRVRHLFRPSISVGTRGKSSGAQAGAERSLTRSGR